MGGRKRAEPQRLVPGDGAAAAKRVKKEEVKAEVKVEPGVDEPIDLTGVSESDPDDDAKLADSLRGGPRTIVDAPLYPPTIVCDDVLCVCVRCVCVPVCVCTPSTAPTPPRCACVLTRFDCSGSRR